MKILIVKPNFGSVSNLQNGNTQILVADPEWINTERAAEFGPELFIVSKELTTYDQTQALRIGYMVTKYSGGNLQKVVML